MVSSYGYCTVMWWNFPFLVSLYVSDLTNVTNKYLKVKTYVRYRSNDCSTGLVRQYEQEESWI